MTDPLRASVAVDFEAFFRGRYRSAARFAFLLTGSAGAAEEIAQEALAQMFRRWSEIRQPDSYLWRALVSGARSWGRRERRQPSHDIPASSGGEPDADAMTVRAALMEIPARQREALVLRYFLGHKDREIAEVMGCPIGTVKSLIHRGLARMQEALR